MAGALFAQALGDFQAINRVYPVKMLGHHAGFIALQGANQMPLQLRRHVRRKLAQVQDFFHALLHIVFAKTTLACGCGMQYALCIDSLTHGQ